ncbi:hypothetical protein PYW07_013538 [Mythimna separata]|uniref:Uncharacterized protein n=1 Tax=Mythimna separata TaxID=271217 RepID=A0AAD7YAP6_MYTSE|nr:hypothetical protein PYW07_013538 [Mythimna separata]
MSNNNEQNGRQPPLPQQTAPSTTASTAPTDPRIRNTTVTTSEHIFTYDKRGAKPIFDYWSDT